MSDNGKKKLYLGTEHKNKLQSYAEENAMNQSEAARRLIDHGLEYESSDGLTDVLVQESFKLSVFLTLILSLFTFVHPVFLYYAILSSCFAVGIGLGLLFRQGSRVRSLRWWVSES